MNTLFVKSLLLLIAVSGGFLAGRAATGEPVHGIFGLAAGILVWLAALWLERLSRRLGDSVLSGGLLGLIAGLIAANLLVRSLGASLSEGHQAALLFFASLLLGYLGLAAGSAGRLVPALAERRPAAPGEEPEQEQQHHKILDTSVIIDGRIADIVETSFLEGTFVIPQFVLRELQHIADSSDSLKRNRGRRGLDILQILQKKVDLAVEIVETDFPRIREVDGKLIALAKQMGAKIITNDFNLNKIAELQGVTVLNINQLANALKPVVLPGEVMKVLVLKEGKELNQGVAYLDDGTMVVIDNARKQIGRTVEVLVTSVLQTTAGRMIFTQLKDEAVRNGQVVAERGP